MVLPALRALPRSGQRWVGAAHPRVAALYEAAGLFETVLPARGRRAPWELRSALRAFRPERAVVFTAAVSGALLARMSGARLRLGRGRGLPGALLTHRLAPAARRRSLWREFLDVAVAAGGREDGPPDFSLEPGPENRASADRLLASLASPVALAPGSAYGPAKQWPRDRFLAAARALREAGRDVVTVGGPGERDLGEALAAGGARDLTGKTSLLEAVAVLSRCAALVSNDSGALHLGRAAGVPVVALFGSSSPDWTGPAPHEGATLFHDVPCRPCFRRRCPLKGSEHLACLRGVSVDAVVEAVAGVAGRR
jgi:heptosyltransferase-2